MQHTRDFDAHTPRLMSKCVRAETPSIQLSLSIYDADLTDTVDVTSSIEEIALYFDRRAAPGPASLVRAFGHCQRGDVHDASQEFFVFLGARDEWFDFDLCGESTGSTANIRE